MGFNPTTGIYTSDDGAVNATPGAVIRSATWNTINADYATALTQLAQGIFTPTAGMSLANGLNSNVPLSAPYNRITGPTGLFSLGGLIPSSIGTFSPSGQKLFLYNSTGQQMVIVNNDASSSSVNRITTLTGANVTLRAGTSAATLMYDPTDKRWILFSTN